MNPKILFCGLIWLAAEMADRGILQRDPHNQDNIVVYYPDEEKWYSVNLHTAMSQVFHSEDEIREFLKLAETNGIDIRKYTNPCQGCRYYDTCGDVTRIGNCSRREEDN